MPPFLEVKVKLATETHQSTVGDWQQSASSNTGVRVADRVSAQTDIRHQTMTTDGHGDVGCGGVEQANWQYPAGQCHTSRTADQCRHLLGWLLQLAFFNNETTRCQPRTNLFTMVAGSTASGVSE